MKRTALLRRAPLARGSSLLSRSKPMKRTRLVSRVKVRTTEQGGDEAYLDFVRGLPCCVYGTAAPSHAHHETGNHRGKGLKAHDHRTMPMSFRAHREFHDGTGFCKGWSRVERLAWQSAEIDRVRAIWLEFQETGVLVEPLPIAI